MSLLFEFRAYPCFQSIQEAEIMDLYLWYAQIGSFSLDLVHAFSFDLFFLDLIHMGSLYWKFPFLGTVPFVIYFNSEIVKQFYVFSLIEHCFTFFVGSFSYIINVFFFGRLVVHSIVKDDVFLLASFFKAFYLQILYIFCLTRILLAFFINNGFLDLVIFLNQTLLPIRGLEQDCRWPVPWFP